MKICVFGASGRELDRDYYEATEELGALIAEHGHTLVFGGSRNGLMVRRRTVRQHAAAGSSA